MKFRNYTKWSLIILLIAGFGIFLLNVIGKSFIQEIVQEVAIETAEGKVFGINIDQEAPHWELLDLNGNTTTLSDFLGKPFILTFWTTWNSMSADQIKIFDEYLSQNEKGIFEIVSINNQEDKSIVLNFIERGGYEVPVLLDETGKVGELYKVRTLPITYFLDKNGMVQDVFAGALSQEMLVEKVQKIIR